MNNDYDKRRGVGSRLSRKVHVGFVLDALEQALHARRPARNGASCTIRIAAAQYVSIRYTERLADASIETSVGGAGDTGLVETINGLDKTEVISRRGSWPRTAMWILVLRPPRERPMA